MSVGRVGLPALVVALGAAPLAAQSECSSRGYVGAPEAACQTAVDAMKAFHPIAGVLVSGGNPVLGTAGMRGGLPHLSLTARLNAAKISLPNPDSATASSVPSSDSGYVPAPVVEGALGIFPGLGGGLLAIDILGSASLLPTTQVKNLYVDTNATRIGEVALGLGYGARIGVLKGGFPIPAVSVSVMWRDLPQLRYGDLSAGDQMEFSLDMKATNVRVTAGTRLLLLEVAAGVGWDTYTSARGKTYVAFSDPTRTPNRQQIDLPIENKRTVFFLDAALNLALLKIAAEIGTQTGTDQQFGTTFRDFNPKDGHFFGSLGVRLTF